MTLLRPPAFVREVHKPMVKNMDGALLAPILHIAALAEKLDWDAFSKWYFPDRRRHDLEAVVHVWEGKGSFSH